MGKRFLPFEWNDNLEAILAERENFSYFKTCKDLFKDVLCYFISNEGEKLEHKIKQNMYDRNRVLREF